MFDYTLVHWLTFLTAAVLLNLSPGPDMAFILGQTVKNGRQGGFAAMFGIWSGAFIHVVLAAAGLSAILATSALAFSIVKWVGAAYLVWIGLQALFSKSGAFTSDKATENPSLSSIYWQGILVATLNPKVAIFFLAFLPQLFLHGFLIIIVAALIEPPLVITGSKLTKALKNNRQIGIWMDRSLGALFISLGIRLATSDQN